MTPETPTPAPLTTPEPSNSSCPKPGYREFIGRFLARNPFYLASAALLLFGINRLSTDPTFLGAEEPKLAFNFAALQLYAILLVFVAVVLGLRKIWYDSTLLVVLENGLLLVPFILVTQAILNSYSLALALSVAGTLMAVTRYGALLRWMPSLQLSPRMLQCGALILAANLALPIVFRQLMEKSVDDWETPGLIAWLLVLPGLAGLANLLPRPTEYSDLPPRKSWLPMLLFGLWIGGSAVHLWSIGYVAERSFRAVYLLPLFWVVAWTLYNRIADFRQAPSAQMREGLLYVPMFLPFLGAGHWNGQISFALLAANFVIYVPLGLAKSRTAALHMVWLNAAVLVASLPLDWGQAFLADFTRANAIVLAAGAYILLRASVTGNPAVGLAAAVAVGIAPAFLLDKPLWNEGLHLGCTFLLLHSVWWREQDNKHASLLRVLTASTWAMHALVWTTSTGSFSRIIVPASGLAVIAGYLLFRLIRGRYAPVVVLAAGSVSLCAVPLHHLIRLLKASPTGLLSIMASFVLFGAGTILAMNKHRWQQALARARKTGK